MVPGVQAPPRCESPRRATQSSGCVCWRMLNAGEPQKIPPYKRGSQVRKLLRPPAGQGAAGELWRAWRRVGTRSAGEGSQVKLGGIRRGQRPFPADLGCRRAERWECKCELASCRTLAAGGALQVFGLVNGAVRKRALGAQKGALVGAQSGRALSYGLLKRPAARLETRTAGHGSAPCA